MSSLIYKTSYVGSNVSVFADRLEWGFLLSKKSIPVSQIASIDQCMTGYAGIKLETTGGKKIAIPVSLFAKKKLVESIYQAKSTSATGGQIIQQSSDLDELDKLAKLKEKGVISEQEFDAKKKQLLGL